MPQSRIGVVLSSGGGRGVFGHTGFMLALDHLAIRIRACAGCSAGAVVGGVIASGTQTRRWADALTRVTTQQIWTPRPVWRLLAELVIRKGKGLGGLSNTAAPIRFLEEQLTAQTFEDCQFPFAAVAVNLATTRKAVFHRGLLAPRLMASAAMPGFYEPVEIDGERYTDGAIIDLAPADAICCRHELDALLIHHVAQRDYGRRDLDDAFARPWTIVNILHRLIYRRQPWYVTGRPRAVHPCPCGCKAVIVVVEPKLPELPWPMTHGTDVIVEAARSHAVAQLEPLIRRLHTDARSLLATADAPSEARPMSGSAQ